MNLYGICLVKDEDDIISQTLEHAIQFCEKVFVMDNGSVDATWQIVHTLAKKHSQIVPFLQTSQRYRNGLRSLAYNEFHHELSNEDWWMILDADEFLDEDPRPLIECAVHEDCDIIRSWQIQFYYTELDHQAWSKGLDSRDLPISARRRFYLINWQEFRLFRNQRESPWDEGISNSIPNGLGKVAKRRIYNRHYQYRDPEQIKKRLNNRFGQPHGFRHVKSRDWKSVIRASQGLNYYREGEPWRFRPSGVLHYYRRRLIGTFRGKIRGAVRKLRPRLS